MKRLIWIFRCAILCLMLASPALLRAQVAQTGAGRPTPGSAACAPATAFLARTSGVSGGDQAAITAFMCGLVTDGLLTNASSGYCGTLFDAIYLLAMNVQANGANLNLCSSSFTLTPNGSPTFTADQGYTGVDSSATVYLDTGLNPSLGGTNFVQNSAHFSVWSNTSTASTSSGGAAIGTDTAVNNIFPQYSSGSAFFRINDSGGGFNVAVANALGFYLANRTGPSAAAGYKNATSLGAGGASTAPVNANFAILSTGPSGGFGWGGQAMAATIGSQLTGTQITNLCHRLNLYLNTVSGISSGTC